MGSVLAGLVGLGSAALGSACTAPEPRPTTTAAVSSGATSMTETKSVNAPATPPAVEAPLAPVRAVYPWREAAASDALPTARLDGRFRELPDGFHRVETTEGSFADFLRTLPLLPEGAPVVDYRGIPLYNAGHHPRIAAVVDLDVGNRDLQQCADTIIRLHAEWRYGKGDRDIGYRAVSGQTLSYKSWMAGDRSFADGNKLVFRHAAAPAQDAHPLFRSWLEDVFAWAGTASVERDGKKVPAIADIAAGDFFVMTGAPFGHAVLVLDVAKDEHGRTAILLGQSYMPAQSFQILRPITAETGPKSAWFIVEPGAPFVDTPFWRPFPVTSLHRFG